ncbi:MAG: PIN domain-containing protein [Pseudomonadota bacterium]
MIIADTGFWLALFNREDAWHERAVSVSRVLRERLVTTWPVLTEATHLLAARGHQTVAMRFQERCFSGAVDIVDLDDKARPRVLELMRKYEGLPMDLADASLVILAEKLGHGRILSTDQRDFQAYRWKNHAPFENLLLG